DASRGDADPGSAVVGSDGADHPRAVGVIDGKQRARRGDPRPGAERHDAARASAEGHADADHHPCDGTQSELNGKSNNGAAAARVSVSELEAEGLTSCGVLK